MKKKIIILLVIFILIISAIVSGIVLYKTIYSPKNIIITALKSTTSKLSKDNIYKSSNFISLSIDDLNNKSNSNLNDIYLTANLKIDSNNKVLDSNINVNYKGNKMFNIVAYEDNNILYFYIDGLYDKYISIPLNKDNQFFNLSQEEKNKITKTILEAIESSLKKDYFVKKIEKINNRYVNVSMLNIDDKNKRKIVDNIKSYLIKNSEFLNILSKASGEEASKIKKYINKYEINRIENISISTYTSIFSNKFVGLKISKNKKNSFELVKLNDKFYTINIVNKNKINKCYLKITGNKNNKIYTLYDDKKTYQFIFRLNKNSDVEIKNRDVSNNINYETFMQIGIKNVIKNLMESQIFIDLMGNMNLSSSDDTSIDETVYDGISDVDDNDDQIDEINDDEIDVDDIDDVDEDIEDSGEEFDEETEF